MTIRGNKRSEEAVTGQARTLKREDEIIWLEAWLAKEVKRAWVPWIKPIIAQNKKRLASLRREEHPNAESAAVAEGK